MAELLAEEKSGSNASMEDVVAYGNGSSSAEPAAAPAPPPDGDALPAEGGSSLGKRKVIPTMVKIGNEFVKRQNMYDMDTGERSVFDSEFDGTRDAAFAPRDRPVYTPGAPAAAAASSAPPRAAYVPSAAEQRRMANNEALKADKANLAMRRAQFFHTNRARIEHFVEPKVLASLASAAASAPRAPARRPVMSQPDEVVGGEMRDYQMVGLDWLADTYERHGLCPILGDEMCANRAPPSAAPSCSAPPPRARLHALRRRHRRRRRRPLLSLSLSLSPPLWSL